MHPFTLSEVLGLAGPSNPDEFVAPPGVVSLGAATEAIRGMLARGTFPEPFLSGDDRFAARWRLSYDTRLVREEIRDLERIHDLDKIERLSDRLPETVGSVLSLNALREDLEVAHDTVKHWVDILERLHSVFRVPPFGTPRIKAVKKNPKLYLWDVGRVPGNAAKLENLVMLHLARLVDWMVDEFGERTELRFVRDVVGHEVDALVVRRGRPWIAVEVKTSDGPLDAGLRYFLERVKTPHAFQVSLEGTVDRRLPDVNGAQVRAMPLASFLAALP